MHSRRLTLFPLTIFISAFLLFQVQPLISRFILPWFGGTPAVWSTSMLFFQVLLLAGYAYAHWLSARQAGQIRLHLALLGGSVILLLLFALLWGAPLLPAPAWKPVDSSLPALRILAILLASVGLPYFLLSSTSPLLQSWFKLLSTGRSPYRLYALSNLGSFLALFSYPLLFEPLLRLKEQARLWSAGYLLFAGLGAVLALHILSMRQEASPQVEPPSDETSDLVLQPESETTLAPTHLRRLLWISLPACTSILLLAITSQLTQEVAVVPFLWVLPLSLYLLSFTIAFSGEKWYPRLPTLLLLGAFSLLAPYAMIYVVDLGVAVQIAINAIFLFLATLACHGELYRLRPHPHELTSFYLFVSLGGALGGLFVSLVAPLLFRGYWELHLGLLLTWLLLGLALLVDRTSIVYRRPWGWLAVLIFLSVAAVSGSLLFNQYRSMISGTLIMERNFYGVFRLRTISIGKPENDAISLNHGITAHGNQYIDPALRRTPTSYYGTESGIGLAIRFYPESRVQPPEEGLRVGVIGLGTGTIAAYSRPEDVYRFYEINPDIITLARGKGGFFSYLSDSQAIIEVIPGDARLSLEQELESGQSQHFDILAVDAFSSDSIPVHLLTQEAFEIYTRHLKPEGVLAIHISNRYLDLAPLVDSLARQSGMDVVLVASPRTDSGAYGAVWVLASKNKAFFRLVEIRNAGKSIPKPDEPVRPWTDDYSNLLPFLRTEVFFRWR